MLKTIARALDPTADAITLLKEDHRKVEALFSEYESAQDKRRKGAIAQRICAELDLHARIEEAVFYPAAKREVKEAHDEVNEATVEHAAIKRLVGEIQAMAPADEMFDAKVTVLIEFVKHHVREEEHEMFPKLTESDLDLKMLREQLEQAKQRLAGSSRGQPPKAVTRKGSTKRRPARRAAKRSTTQARGKGRKRG